MLFRNLGVLGKRFAQAFLPSKILGLQLWLDATDTTTLNAKMCADFNGTSDALNIDALITPLTSTTIGTWSAWVNMDSYSAYPNVLTFGDTDGSTFMQLSFSLSGNVSVFAYNLGVTKFSISTDAVHTGGWKHLAVVQDGVLPVIYVDGVAVAQTATTSTDTTFWFNDFIGLDNGRIGALNFGSAGDANWLNGRIDEVAIWDRVVTATELLATKDLAIANWTTAQKVNLVAHYDMNEGASATRVDSIGGYNATNIGTVGVALGYLQSPITANDYVWRWTDKSTNLFNIDQNTAVDQGEYLNPDGQILFDGVSDYYDISQVYTPLSATTKGTICLRVKFTSLVEGTIMSFGGTTSNDVLMLQVLGGGTLRLKMNKNATNFSSKVTTATYSINTWYHIAVIQDGVDSKIYVDNVEQSTTNQFGNYGAWIASIPNLDNSILGAREFNSGGVTSFFDGSIGEPLIYDTNLTTAQLTQIYNYSLATYS